MLDMTGKLLPAPAHRDEEDAPSGDGIRGTLLMGLGITALLVVGLGGWAALTTLSGAVIVPGTVVVQSSVKPVRHQIGGIVDQIKVGDGDRVAADQLLIHLDETLTRANLQIIRKQLDSAIAREARLNAEQLGLPEVALPDAFAGRSDDPDVVSAMAGERIFFESRRKGLAGQEAQLRERAGQLERQIEGLEAQQRAITEAEGVMRRELAGVEKLYAQNLVSIDRLSALQREAARLHGEAGRLIAAVAETEGRITETELQILQLEETMRTEVIRDLRETEGRRAELTERKLAAEDQLARTDIRAPQAGVVQELAVHARGAVIAPGEIVMQIVPDNDTLVVEARIPPQEIDDLSLSQPVLIRFSAFDMASTPECRGSIQRISADLVRDARIPAPFYVARVGLDPADDCLVGSKTLLPGMPAEVHIKTGDRSVWSYMMKPLLDQLARAFKA